MRFATPTPSARLTADGERLVREHLRLVSEALRQVGRRLPAHVDRDDLAGAGAAALVEAAHHFDPERGSEFAAFAAKRVRGAMLDELRRWDWAARSVRTEERRRDDVVENLQGELGRRPSSREVATALGITVEHLRRTQSDVARATLASLQDLAGDGAADPLSADGATPVEVLLERERKAYLRDAVDALPDRERHAVAGYYLRERPMRELAGELGVTGSRVSQLCKQGLARLRDGLASYELDRDPAAVHPAGVAAPRRRTYLAVIGCGSDWKARPDAAPLARPELLPLTG